MPLASIPNFSGSSGAAGRADGTASQRAGISTGGIVIGQTGFDVNQAVLIAGGAILAYALLRRGRK